MAPEGAALLRVVAGGWHEAAKGGVMDTEPCERWLLLSLPFSVFLLLKCRQAVSLTRICGDCYCLLRSQFLLALGPLV